jgi:hypothetical protein
MKFRCACGEVIVDQVEFNLYKARLIADRDWNDYLDAAGTAAVPLERNVYQCMECGRLHLVLADGTTRSFIPEQEPEAVLDSSLGDAWKAPLVGLWDDRTSGTRKLGWLDCDATGGTTEGFDTWEELEHAYFQLFYRLRKFDRVRSALLRRNDETIHVWSSFDEV